MSFFNGMVNNTYVISYMGRLRLNDYAQYAESAHFFSDTICGLTINMVAAAGKLSLEVLQGFHETKYVEAFAKALAPYGLLWTTATERVVTGKDKSFVTASHQAERYRRSGTMQSRKRRGSEKPLFRRDGVVTSKQDGTRFLFL